MVRLCQEGGEKVWDFSVKRGRTGAAPKSPFASLES